MNKHTQILVIGGGPAGSTSACLLARAGFDVTLVDREVFPRYHIGESLLPGTVDIYDLMGAREKIEKSAYPRKYGSHFDWGTEQWSIHFADALGKRIYGFHVDRTSFDHLLLEHARSQGVKVFEGVAIESLSFDGDRPKEATWTQVVGGEDKGNISFDYLIDASGRAGLITTRYLKNRHYHQAFQNVAIWGYWENAKRLENAPEGAIAIIAVPDGWFWGIPLPDNKMSVGLVIHKKAFQAKRKQTPSLEQIYLEAINDSPRIADLVKPGKLISSMRVEQDYSYAGDSFSGPGYFISGDAACFLDPLLSTGVHLAMFSALLASACIISVSRGEIEEEEAAAFYSESYRQTYLRLLVLVSSLYQQYRGKESYFWDAQQLTHHDYNSRDLSTAFRSIMSGQEDMKDIASAASEPILTRVSELYAECIKGLQIQNPGQTMAEEDREKAQAVFKQLNAVISPSSLSPEKAVDGWYVRMRPQLGLVRARSASCEDLAARQL